MTVRELIGLLDQFDPESSVRIMSQPNWPFEYSIAGVWQNENDDTDDAFVMDDDGDDADPGPKPVFIVEGTQRGYGTKRAWDEMLTR